jgi:hypothetical protein
VLSRNFDGVEPPATQGDTVHYSAQPLVSTTLAHEFAAERRAAASRHRAARPLARAARLRRRAAGRPPVPAFPAVAH